MPSKGIRNSAIDALDAWYHVPEKSLITIREIISMLHSCSLMYISFLCLLSSAELTAHLLFRLDDIEDNSPLRRGFPATHMVFGVSQTINSANLLLIKALRAAESLSPAAVAIFSGTYANQDCLLDSLC